MPLFEKISIKLLAIVSTLLGLVWFALNGVKHKNNFTLFGLPIISKFSGSEIELGNRVVLCSISSATALGINHPVVLRTLATGAKIVVGDDVGMSGCSICAGSQVTIGAYCMFGANVVITDTDFHDFTKVDRRYSGLPSASQFSRVTIEENVFLGTNVVVLKGVKIGKNSVIGAGSIVVDDIPSDVIAAGNPCKVIKSI